jgi:hypothetical protein
MLNTLQALVDAGISGDTLDSVLSDLLAGGDRDDYSDCRGCVAFAWARSQGEKIDPVDCTVEDDHTVDMSSAEYRVLTDDEADAALVDHIENTYWAFTPGFLCGETGIDGDVFAALADKCEESNDAVRALIAGTCGIDSFIEAVAGTGRGGYLAQYDGEEIEYRTDSGDYWYLYRVN